MIRATAVVFALVSAAPAASAADLAKLDPQALSILQLRLIDAGCYKGSVDGRVTPALSAAVAACPDQDPILRVETGAHTKTVQALAIDRACRIAATGSLDKTVRIWSLPEGRLIRTQRLPIADKDFGQIQTVAITPDGKLIAAAGKDAAAKATKTSSVYLFDTETGISIRRIGRFDDDFVTSIAFSPDGRLIAVAAQNLEVFDVASGRRVMKDEDYEDYPPYQLVFGADGALYTTSDDRFVRRYGPDLRRTAKVKLLEASGGAIAIDATGQRLAFGYYSRTGAVIVDARTLRKIASVNSAGLRFDDDRFLALAWVGDRLYGAGNFALENRAGNLRPAVKVWDAQGRAVALHKEVGTALGINAAATCGGDLYLGNSDPVLAVLRSTGRFEVLAPAGMPDTLTRGKEILISDDGQRVRFAIGEGDEDFVLFDLATSTLAESPVRPAGLHGADTKGLRVTDWESTQAPKLNGSRLELGEQEESNSLAIRPDRSGFVLGAEFNVWAFSANGTLRWKAAGNTGAGVAFARKGEVVVVVEENGTVRWLRWSDGGTIATLFVEKAAKRWILWTPAGYYTASPGAEELIGWHVNRGWEQPADFFPASRFREQFYRPDIVKLVFATLDEDKAIQQANAAAPRGVEPAGLLKKLPPVIEIKSHRGNQAFTSTEVTLAYEWRSPSGQQVERVDVRVDGNILKSFALPIQTKTLAVQSGTLTVTLPARNVEVALIARSGELASEPARVSLVWGGAAAPAAPLKPSLYALVIGVSDYTASDLPPLSFASKDAQDFARALRDQKGSLYGDVQVRLLDKGVTRDAIMDGLEWLEREVTSRDVAVLFLAGHALTDEKQTYWFLPYNASLASLRRTGVSHDDLKRTMYNLAGKAVWFLDTCHAAGAFAGNARGAPIDINGLINDMSASENGVVAFASSQGRELSFERAEWRNGAFTKALIEAIEDGRADLIGDGTVTISALDAFVVNRVKQLTEGKQHPVMTKPKLVADFPIAVVRKR